jgi:hypothetical protein
MLIVPELEHEIAIWKQNIPLYNQLKTLLFLKAELFRGLGQFISISLFLFSVSLSHIASFFSLSISLSLFLILLLSFF